MQSTSDPSSSTLAHLLHQTDSLSTSFRSLHSSSLQSILSISSANAQLENLKKMPSSGRMATRSGAGAGAGEMGLKERGMVKVQEVVEEGLMSVRDSLGKMEGVVEQLGGMSFQADLFLSTPSLSLQHSLNPKEALTHISSLYTSYQAELIRLRELLSDFTCEEIGVDELVKEWRSMKEVEVGEAEDLGDLVDVMGSWGGSGDVDMG